MNVADEVALLILDGRWVRAPATELLKLEGDDPRAEIVTEDGTVRAYEVVGHREASDLPA